MPGTRFSLFLLSVWLFASCTAHKPQPSLTIATSANTQFVMAELVESFSAASGTECEMVINSSGHLAVQIRNGAPYDVFVSADLMYPQLLFDSGFAQSPPKVYGYGHLVLWTLNENLDLSNAEDALKSAKAQHIAIPNPKTAPYGQAANEYLINTGLYYLMGNRLVYGESVTQTNQFITSRSADMGITAKSVVVSPQMKGKGHWVEMDTQHYTPIKQGMVVVKRESTHPQAQAFYNFVFSPKGQEILEKFGYHLHE